MAKCWANNFDRDCSRLPVKKLRFRLLQKRRKVRVSEQKGIRKNIISYYSSAFTINPQPRRRSVRPHSVLILFDQGTIAENCVLPSLNINDPAEFD